MKQKIEKVIRNKKVAIALMECAVAIGCIVIFCLFMIPKDRIPDTTHSYSKVEKVTKYKVVDNYITRVMPLTDYKTFKEIAEKTLNEVTKEKNYTVKVYFDAEKTKEVTSGYIASGMIAEVENKAVKSTDVAGKTELEENEEENNKTVSYTISIIGDMTKDGDINVTELTKMTKCVIGLSDWNFTEEEKLAADLNGDGQIDIADIESCINYIVFGELNIQEEKYTVTFKDYDGSIISTKTNYHYGDKIEIPNDPTREADETYTYEFAGWNPEISGTETVTGNAEYIATYRMVANRAKYTVEHYKQEVDGTYKLAETEDLEGTIGEKVTATAKNYEGYSEDTKNENRIAEGIVEKEENLVLRLYYKINQYTVTFKNEDGTVISQKTDYHYGDTVVVPENPTKPEDQSYTYKFAGWKKVGTEQIGVKTVTEDAEYIATYTSTYKGYKITFKNDDGTIISEKADYHYGDTVIVPQNPTKEDDENYTYEFVGWKKVGTEEIGVKTVTEDTEYIATYTSNYKEYTITFEDYDGTVISKKTDYHYGQTVSVPDSPTRVEDETYTYEFAGWKNEKTEEIGVKTVTGNAKYIATYTSNYKEYKVTFKNDDGEVISEKTDYHYGDTVAVPENPTKEDDRTYTYEFAGWKNEETEEIGVKAVTGNTGYIATYTSNYKEYKVTFKNDDGTIISEKTDYHYGETVVVPGNPIKAEDETYTYEFAGWKKEGTEEIGVTAVTGDAEYIATYGSTYREYTIIFEDYDGTVISKKTDYHYGDTVEVPEEPTREEDETYTYEFAGWDKEITEVTKNTTYIATYINKYKEYTVTFKQDTGDIINSTTYHYGDTIEVPEDPKKEATVEYAYTFAGWTPEVEETVRKSAEYMATYEEQAIKYNFIFYNDDGVTEVARIENYRWGDNIKLPTAPTKEPTEEINYVFSEWKNLGIEEVSETQKNIRFMAQYAEKYFVARLEETENFEGASYMTLQEAIDAAGEDIRTIKLLKDTEESVLVEDVQNVAIDLNGKTVTGSKTGTKAYAVKNYGTLEITDTTEEKRGKIQESATGSLGYGIYNRDGSLTVKSGMIVTETTQESGATYGIYNQSEEPLIIEGGSIVAEAKGKSSTSCGIYNLAGKEIIVSGGSVLGNAIAEKSTSYGIYNATEGTINVSNGSVEGKSSLSSATSYGIYNVVSENVEIQGGKIVAQADLSVAYGVYNKKGKVTVLGGNIEVTAAKGYGIYNEAGNLEVQSGTMTIVGSNSYGIYNDIGTIKVSGGDIDLLGTTLYGIYNCNEMNITGGNINSKTAGQGYGIYNNLLADANVKIENTTIKDTLYGIYNIRGNLIISSSSITANTGIYVYYKTGNNFITTVESSEVTSKSKGIYNDSDSGTIILKNVNIISDDNGIRNVKGNIEIGSKDGTINAESPRIFGKNVAISNSANIKYYDGILIGNEAIYGGINEIEENSEIVMTTNEEGNEVVTLQKVQPKNVAKIGENQYQDLTQAVDAVLENAEQGRTIEILTDFAISKMVEIPENKKVTIDLAGYTVTTYARGGIINKGTLEITDSTEEALGKIKSEIGVVITNEGDLTLDKGTIEAYGNGRIDSRAYGILNSKNTVVKEGLINSKNCGISGGNITVENGTITGTYEGIMASPNTVVTIKGGKIKGNTAVDASAATINIEGGQIEGENYGIKSHSSIVNVKNGNIIGKDIGLSQAYGTTQITGGSIKGTYGVINKEGTCIIGTKDNQVKQEEPIIIGEKHGIVQRVENRKLGIFQYYDGKIAGQTKAIDGSVNEVEEEKQIQINTETIDELEYQVTSLVDEEVYESGIAQIGDNVYTTVSSLKQAIDEIETNTEQPVKVTILNDFEITQTIPIKSEQNIKINLNGKTITSIASITNNGNLEITDETEESQGKLINSNGDAIVDSRNLTVTKGTIEGARYGIYGLPSTSVILGTKDEEVDVTSPIIIGKERGIAAYYSSVGAKMYDGKIKGKASSKSYIGETEEEYKVYDYKEDGYYITSLELESPIARTGGQDYNSLQEAIDACANNGTIEILRNISNIVNTITIPESKTILLDLNNKEITANCEKFLVNNGTLIVGNRGGTIDNVKTNGITIQNNGELNLLKGNMYSRHTKGTTIQNNGVLNVSGGSISGGNYGINNNENATLTIQAGYISSTQYAIYNNSANTINITGGNIYTNNNGMYTYTYGIYNNSNNTIHMTGGTVSSSNPSPYNSSGYVAYGIYNNANGNIIIETISSAINVRNTEYGYGIYNNAEGNITLENGSITVESCDYLSYGIRNMDKGKVQIKSGNINAISKKGYAYGIENNSFGSVEMLNGNVLAKTEEGTSYGIRNISINTLAIKNGSITATGTQSYGIYNNTSDIMIGEENTPVSNDTPIIESDFVGIYVAELDAKFNFYDGKVLGKQPINISANVPEGYKLLQYYDKEKQKEVAMISELDNYVLTYYLNGEKYDSIVLKSGSTIPEKTIEEEGYEFSGWGEVPETMPEENIDIYGTLTPKTYTITYYVDGVQYGEVDTFEYKSEVTPREIPTKEGHEFSGWSEIPETMPAEDIKVRGVFTYTATFYNEDKTSVIATVPFTVNDASIEEPEIEEKEGYTRYWSEYELVAENIEIQLISVEKKAVINKLQGKSYDKLESAIAEAKTDGTKDEIYLLEDINIGTTLVIPENTNIELDLNGHNIINNSTYCVMDNYGTLTIKNGGEGTSRIEITKEGTNVYGIYNRNKVIVDNVEIEVISEDSYNGIGIYNEADATTTLGKKDEVASITMPKIVATTFAISNESGIFNFYDGQLIANNAINGEITETELGYDKNIEIIEGKENCYLEELPYGADLQAVDDNGITWNFAVYDKKATIINYDSSDLPENLVIPSTLRGYPVTSIGECVFEGCDGLVSVKIPNGVISIGNYVFNECHSLTSIEIPSSVTNIGDFAFFYCSNLTNIKIPSGVTSIGEGTFAACDSLVSVEIPNSVTSIGDNAFDTCGSLTGIEIPNGVINIGTYVFNECYSLTSIEIPNGVTSIGDGAFRECSSLTNIKIPSSVTSIGDSAFYGCSSLTSIEIPESVTSIGDSAFYGCSSLTSINVGINNTEYSSDNGVLFNKDKTELIAYPAGKEDTEYIIPNSVTSIGSYGFGSCTNLTNIEIPSGVTSIGHSAFENCSSLTNIEIPSGVTSIENWAFASCYSLTSIKIPNGVTSIGSYGFSQCSSLTSIEIPNSVTSIGSNAFQNCFKLTDIYVDNLKSNVTFDDTLSKGNSAYIHYSDCKHEIIATMHSKIKIEIQEIRNNLKDEKIACRDTYQFKLVNEEGEVITSEKVKVKSQGKFINSKVIGEEIAPNEEGIYTIERVNRNKVVVIGEYEATIQDGIIWNYQYQDGKAVNVYYESGTLPEVLNIPESLDGYSVVSLYNNSVEGSIFANAEDEFYISEKRVDEYYGYKSNVNVKVINIPSTVTTIGNNAFERCSNLETINISNSVTDIGDYAFYGCGLTSINMGDNVTNIGKYAFSNCTNLVSAEISNSIAEIKEGTFRNCGNLTNVNIPEEITSIGDYAFYECRDLKNVALSKNIKYIGLLAFGNCTSLESIVIWKNVDEVGYRTFIGWRNMQTINLEAEEIPEGWNKEWNNGCNATIVYGYTGK